MGKEIVFYYDVICPYAYLASKLIEDVASRNGAKLLWRPVLLGGIYKLTKPETMDLPDNKMINTYSNQKRRVMAQDLAIKYNRHGIKFTPSLTIPDIRTINAMRLVAATPDETGNLRKKITHSLFDAVWLHQKDVSDLTVLQHVVDSLDWNINVQKFVNDSCAKQTLINNTNEAVERGAFGVPSMWVNNKLHFGADRLFFVEQELGNTNAEPTRLLSKPLHHIKKAKLTVYFDFASPWSYIGFIQIPQLLKRVSDVDVEVEWIPVLLGAIFKEIGTPGVPMMAMGTNKRKYMFADFQDWLSYRGIKNFKFSSHFPLRTPLPLRIATANPDYNMMEKIYNAAWVKDLDISDEKVLQNILSSSGYDFEVLIQAASSEKVKLALRKNTQRALDVGACGNPSYQVNDGPLIFGQDNLNIIEDMIYGWKYDGPDFQTMSKL